MKLTNIVLAASAAFLAAGCSNLDNTRALNDPKVPGQTIAKQVCSACHGDDGNSVSPEFPKLASQQKEYLMNQLKNFRGHDRMDPPGPEYMWGLSRSLTNTQIRQIADYFNAQKMAPEPGTPDPARVAVGEKIFQEGLPKQGTPACRNCHGPEALGNGIFPRLSGQHLAYVVRQLHVFQETNFRPNTPMKGITHALTTDQMIDVASYVSTLAGKK